MKHLNVTGDREVVPRFVGPFSIVYQVEPLAYQLNLGTCYSLVHSIFHISLLKPFCASGDEVYTSNSYVYLR